jgi:threonine-phosphate decarboxylase
MSSTKSRHGGDIYGFSDEERDKFLDFSININPLGLSPKGKAALTAGWEKETLRKNIC